MWWEEGGLALEGLAFPRSDLWQAPGPRPRAPGSVSSPLRQAAVCGSFPAALIRGF